MRFLSTAAGAVLLCALVTLAGCGQSDSPSSATAENPYVLQAGIGFNNKMPQYKALEILKAEVEEKSGGRFVIELFHSGALGDDKSMIQALQLGTQHITVPASAPLGGVVESFQVLDLPYLFKDSDVMHDVLSGPAGRGLLDELDEKGLHGLAFWPEGFRCVTNKVRPIRSPEDLKGLKIRTMQTALHTEAFRSWGATPISMSFADLFTAMEQNTVHGQENPPAVPWNNNFFEVQSYFSDTNHFAAPYVLLISGKFWAQLDDADKQIFTEAAQKAYAEHRNIVDAELESILGKLSEKMEVTRLTDDERAAFRAGIDPVYASAREKLGAELVDRFVQAAEESSVE